MNNISETASMNLDESTLYLHGPLTRHTVSGLYEHFSKQYFNNINMIDCSQTGTVDSTGVSFLIACIKKSKETEIPLKITGLNTQTIKLATLYDVDDLLAPK